MLPALHFTRSTRILGCFASGGLYSYLTFALAALVIAVNIVLVVEFVDVMPVGAVVAVCVFGVFYFWICARLVVDDPIARAQQLFTRGTAARRLVRDHPTVRTAASAREAMLESYPALQATSWAVGRSRPRRSSTARRRRPRRRLGRRSGRNRRSCRQRALLATTCCRLLSPYVLVRIIGVSVALPRRVALGVTRWRFLVEIGLGRRDTVFYFLPVAASARPNQTLNTTLHHDPLARTFARARAARDSRADCGVRSPTRAGVHRVRGARGGAHCAARGPRDMCDICARAACRERDAVVSVDNESGDHELGHCHTATTLRARPDAERGHRESWPTRRPATAHTLGLSSSRSSRTRTHMQYKAIDANATWTWRHDMHHMGMHQT